MRHTALLDTNDMHAVWLEQWEECLGDDFEEAQQLTDLKATNAQSSGSSHDIAAFQVQIRRGPRRPRNLGANFGEIALACLLAGNIIEQHNSLHSAATCQNQDSWLVQA